MIFVLVFLLLVLLLLFPLISSKFGHDWSMRSPQYLHIKFESGSKIEYALPMVVMATGYDIKANICFVQARVLSSLNWASMIDCDKLEVRQYVKCIINSSNVTCIILLSIMVFTTGNYYIEF